MVRTGDQTKLQVHNIEVKIYATTLQAQNNADWLFNSSQVKPQGRALLTHCFKHLHINMNHTLCY